MAALKNKVAVVTGGNSGIGRAIARRFQQEGAEVAIFGRNAETLQETAEELGGEPLSVAGDVRNLEDLDRLFEGIRQRHDRIDILVVNAGGATFRPIEEVQEEDFDVQADVNFKGAFFTIQKALPLMGKGGSILLLSSVANSKGYPGTSVYSATKAAVRSLARTLTAELAPRGIRINVLSPGPIETPIFQRTGLPEEQAEAAKSGFISQVPLQRIGQSEEIARAALFLTSDESSYVAGAELAADGGLAQV